MRSASRRSTRSSAPQIRIIFRGGKVYARQGGREWPIAEVDRDEMLWAPDGQRFAYLKPEAPASQPTAQLEPPSATDTVADAPVARGGSRKKKKTGPPVFHVVVRNIRGDSINEFPVYRPGRPTDLDWITNDTLGYVAPPDRTGDVYVIHRVSSSEILRLYRGTRFVWSPGRRQLAYIASPRKDHLVKVDSTVVWPRKPVPEPPRRRRGNPARRVQGELVWSPDGSGLAFMALQGKQSRLVVLLVVDNEQGDLTWPLPVTALSPGNHLFWGERKVVIGESMLKPRFAASWKRLH